MPGKEDVLDEFLASLRNSRLESLIRRVLDLPENRQVRATHRMADALCDLVRTVWKEMEVVDEIGSLLKIEDSLAQAVTKGKAEWEDKYPLFRIQEFGAGQRQPVSRYYKFLPGEEESLWSRSEALVLKALEEYSRYTELVGSTRRRMFAQDAARGFSFVDLCRQRYDVAVMNPPFGDPTRSTYDYLTTSCTDAKTDLLAAFVDRCYSLLLPQGRLGAITKREPLFTATYEKWRRALFLDSARLELLLDLGHGVLDGAMVEVACYVINRDSSAPASFLAFSSLEATNAYLEGIPNVAPNVALVSHDDVRALPRAPLAYDVPANIRRIFRRYPPFSKSLGRTAQGLGTTDDFRFPRLWFEVPERGVHALPIGNDVDDTETIWVPYAKGEPVSLFYADIPMVVNWSRNGAEVKEYNRARYGSASRNVKSESLYGQTGIVFPRRTRRFTPRLLPSGCIFSVGGQVAMPDSGDPTELLGLLASDLCNALLQPLLGRVDIDPQYEVGTVASVPVPEIGSAGSEVASLTRRIVAIIQQEFRCEEPSLDFSETPLDRNASTIKDAVAALNHRRQASTHEFLALSARLNELVADLYGASNEGVPNDRDQRNVPYILEEMSIAEGVELLMSLSLGLSFGWFALDGKGRVTRSIEVRDTTTAVFVDDVGHERDIVRPILQQISVLLPAIRREDQIADEIQAALGSECGLRSWVRRHFFESHLRRFTRNNRKAPIYWPLSTTSGSYTLWVCYQRLTDQTLYKCINDFLDDAQFGKIKDVEREVNRLRRKSTRSSAEEKELEALTDFQRELKDLREELLRIAQFWKPNLNDGVQITAAPLWKLFQHREWRAKLKETWEKLEAGDYDWAHLALSVWPERVIKEACRKDRSIAIAHNLDDRLWEQVKVEKKGRGGRVTVKTEWRPKDLTDEQLDEIVAEVKARR